MSPYSFRFRALILTALLFLLVCTATVNATTITISSKTVPNIQWGGTTATLRIYSSQNFMASDGTPVLAGTVGSTDVYLPISCTISGTTLTVPSFTLQSTLDGADRTDALYTAVFYDSRGNQKSILLGNFAVPATPATTTWDALAILNRSQPGSPGETYSTTAQVRAPFNGVLPAPKASDGVAGMARVSVPPVSSSNPIAVGDNDRRLLDLFNVTKYPYYATPNDSTDDTAAIQAAITAAGGMPVYIPPGQYKITSGLNNSGAPITLWNESAVGEDTNQTNVPVLNWYGAAGGTMLAIRGANYIKIQGIAFEGCPTGTGGADAAISIDTPAGEAKVIIDSCLINFNGVRSTFKAISLSPTASANNENITIRNTYIKASNTFSLAASRGSAIYMGNNSQSDVVVFDHVWLRACNVALRTYGQNITIRDSFIDTSNVGISIGSGDLTVDRVHSELVRQFARSEGGINQFVLTNSAIVNGAWDVATPIFDFTAGGAALEFRNNQFGNGAAFDAAQVFLSTATGQNNSLYSINNVYPNLTDLGFNGLGQGYTSCHDRGLNGEITYLAWAGCLHGGTFRIQPTSSFAGGAATPLVSSHSSIITSNSSPVTITNFVGGRNGQVLIVIAGDANTTIKNNANIVTRSGANITCGNGLTYTFIYTSSDSKWHQVN